MYWIIEGMVWFYKEVNGIYCKQLTTMVLIIQLQQYYNRATVQLLGALKTQNNMFRAQAQKDKQDLIVKFTPQYNAKAHQVLEKVGLAPELLGVIECGGGLKCIVMKKISR